MERQDTGVRFEDVAGIDDVKADIEEVMKMILGDAEYRAMGARPPRVSRLILSSPGQETVSDIMPFPVDSHSWSMQPPRQHGECLVDD